ncbi:acyl-CoA thioesterase [Euzebya sp.]|uniref:acyl-CoA thioesterase n=1 Tax=Euzebya sp. TaxID=1971409 RepID=UPI003517F97D
MTTPLQSLELRPDGPDAFVAHSAALGEGRPVFGGQLLGQVVVAAAGVDPSKTVRSVHAAFPRPGSPEDPLQLRVDPVAVGRTMATATVTVSQGDRRVCVATVLLDTEEDDVLRHGPPPPPAGAPEQAPATDVFEAPGAEVRVVGGLDLDDTGATGDMRLDLWCRWPDVAELDRVRHQALAAWLTDPLLLPTALRSHEGLSLRMAHEVVSTAVITHTLSFHQPIAASDWLLIATECTWAGAGRVYGRGQLFTAAGQLVASYAQDAMLRRFPDHVTARGASSGVM